MVLHVLLNFPHLEPNSGCRCYSPAVLFHTDPVHPR